MRNAMIIDGKDNVVVAIEPIAKGDTVTYLCGGAGTESLTCAGGYHQSITSWPPATLPAGGTGGESMGNISASPRCDIRAGEHVHVHNVEGRRENLDEKG